MNERKNICEITFSDGLYALFPKYLKNSARQNIPLSFEGYFSLSIRLSYSQFLEAVPICEMMWANCQAKCNTL